MENLVKLVQYNILTATSQAGSGHPTSSLSAAELMTELFFGGWLRYNIDDPRSIANDRVIFSKGHAAPLLYALYAAAGYISRQELNSLRQFDSVIEGHPTPRFEPIEVATGSLGQGLSVGLGMALARQKWFADRGGNTDQFPTTCKQGRIPHVYVLLGDSEMAEGQVWEAIQLAGHYQVSNLVGIIDVNRLGQRGATMDGWNVEAYAHRIAPFGWKTIILDDGHDAESIQQAFQMIEESNENGPTMIIAKTEKGHGVSFLADQDGWHGKALPEDKLKQALEEIGPVDTELVGEISQPAIEAPAAPSMAKNAEVEIPYNTGDVVATREAYGDAVTNLGSLDPRVVVLDAETSNSTFAEVFKNRFPDRYYEMFIAEQNMVSVGVGFDKTGYIPYVSSFAAFLSRAFDQIRMAQYSESNLKVIGSHAGISIGQDGSSQMALEDLAMMRSILDSVVLYPSDAISTEILLTQMHNHCGISYLRLTREKTPVLYDGEDTFPIGGSKVHGETSDAQAVIVAAGITLHEALKAQKQLADDGIPTVVVDAYSVKPIDEETITKQAAQTGHVVIAEDHYPYGGLGEAVKCTIARHGVLGPDKKPVRITHQAVTGIPRSGTPAELLAWAGIDAQGIMAAVRQT